MASDTVISKKCKITIKSVLEGVMVALLLIT